jgi:hypothetical protein
MCMFVSDVHICVWYAHLFLVCAFISSVYICIWCVLCICCAHLYLVFMFVSDVCLCIWCAHLYLVACLYLVYTLVSDVHLCIWCACLYLVCIFASGVLLPTWYHPALHPSLVLEWDQYFGHLSPLLMPNTGTTSSNNMARALVTRYLNTVNNAKVCYSGMFVALLVTWYDSVLFCCSFTLSMLLTCVCPLSC